MTGRRDEDDARARWPDFVAARWAALEAVAVAATLDTTSARRLTVAAFREVHRSWARLADDGSPTAALRSALLAAVPTERVGAPAVDPLVAEAVADAGSEVPSRLLGALSCESPLVRAATAAALFWDLGPLEVSALLPRRAAGALATAGPVRERLVTAHREALAADGAPVPGDDRFEGDLADVLHRLADAAVEPTDPAGLVDAAGTSRPGRRLAISGVTGAAALGVAGWLVLERDGADPVGPTAATSRATASPSPSPDSPLWDTALTWPARGGLATDRRVALLVASAGPGARLLFADDVRGARLVAATDPATDLGSDTTAVRWWRGPVGAPPEQLTVASVGLEMLDPDPQKVAYGGRLPSGDSLVLVLGRPTVSTAEVSLRVRPTVEGTVERTWEPLRLEDGIGSAVFREALGPAARLRFDGYDGGLPVVLQDAALETADLRGTVAAATGVDREKVETSVDVRRLPPTVRMAGDQRLYVLRTLARLPSGAVVRTMEVVDGGRTFSLASDGARVVPATEARGPALLSFFDEEQARERLLVLLAERARRVTLTPTLVGRSPSVTVDAANGLAVVDLARATEVAAAPVRVLATDAGGRVVHDVVVDRGVPFLDLLPNEAVPVP